MGKRRIRNLIRIGVSPQQIIGTDVNAQRKQEGSEAYGIECHEERCDDELFFKHSPTIAFICTPPDQHHGPAQKCIDAGCHVFIEASVLDEGLKILAASAEDKNIVLFPSCTMRHFAGPKLIKDLIKKDVIGEPLFWQYQSGQYLPDWHPWEPLHSYYASKKNTGGCREIVPFELNWITDIFGDVEDVFANPKLSDIPADIHDAYFLTLDTVAA